MTVTVNVGNTFRQERIGQCRKYLWSKCTQTAEGVFSVPMAGTAEGAARAREKQRFKQEQRRLLREQVDQLQQAPTQPDDGPSRALMSPDAAVESSVSREPVTVQAVASDALNLLTLSAVAVLDDTMRQRTSPSLRFAAACKVIDATILKPRAKGERADADESMTGRLARAFQLRQQASNAVDATPIREDPVTPEGAVHSQRRADK
jgi:hypothetical protein